MVCHFEMTDVAVVIEVDLAIVAYGIVTAGLVITVVIVKGPTVHAFCLIYISFRSSLSFNDLFKLKLNNSVL